MFQIFKPGGFKFLLKADTDDERESWMQGLLKAAMHNRIDNSHLYIVRDIWFLFEIFV